MNISDLCKHKKVTLLLLVFFCWFVCFFVCLFVCFFFISFYVFKKIRFHDEKDELHNNLSCPVPPQRVTINLSFIEQCMRKPSPYTSHDVMVSDAGH